MKGRRVITIAGGGALLLCAAMLVLITAAVTTEKGRLLLLAQALERLQEREAPFVSVEGATWPEPSSLSAAGIEVRDGQGPWLRLENSRVRFDLRALLNRELVIQSLEIEKALFMRRPGYEDGETNETATAGTDWSLQVQTGRVTALDIGEAVCGLPMKGPLEAGVRLQGAAGEARLEAGELYSGEDRMEVMIRLRWDAGSLALDEFRLLALGARVQGSGDVGFAAGKGHLELRAEHVPLDRVGSAFEPRPWSGTASGSAILDGRGDDWSMSWSTRFEKFSREWVRVDSLTSTGTVQGAGRVVRGGAAGLEAEGLVFSSRSVDAIQAGISISDPGSFALEISGLGRDPLAWKAGGEASGRIEGASMLTEVTRLDAEFGGQKAHLLAPMNVMVSGTVWEVEGVRVACGDALLDAKVSMRDGLSSSGRVAGIDVRWVPVLASHDVGGLFSGEWEIQLSGNTPSGTFNLVASDLDPGESRYMSAWPTGAVLEATLVDEGVRVAVSSVGGIFAAGMDSWIPLKVTNQAPWLLPDPARELRGRLELHGQMRQLMRKLLPRHQVFHGELDLSMEALGTVRDPVLFGKAGLTNGFFEDVIRGTVITGLTSSIVAEKGGDFRVMLSCGDGQLGTIDLSGVAARSGEVVRVSARGIITNFVVARAFGTDVPVDGELQLQGEGTNLVLSGEVVARPCQFRLPPRLPPAIRSVRVIDREDFENGNGNVTKRAADLPLNIDVDVGLSGKGVRLSGRRLRAELEGSGRVAGRLPEPRFGGNVGVVSGTFYFLGRRFTVTRGEVVFPSGRDAEPVLFVTAETRAAGASIQLDVEGPVSDLAVQFSSDPPMDQDEIIARVLFGKPGDVISPWQVAYLAYALDVVKGGGSLMDRLDRGETVLGLDQISIKQSEDESGLSSLLVAKQVYEGIYIESEFGLGSEPDVFAVEAELTPNLILRTETSPRIREGISLFWRRDY